MGVSIQIMDKSLCKGRNRRNYLHFNTVCQLQAAVSDVYSMISKTHESGYSLKSHQGSVIHMYEGDMQSALVEKFVKGMNRRIPEDSDCNKPMNYLVVNYILNHIEHDWLMPNTDPGRNRELLMTAA